MQNTADFSQEKVFEKKAGRFSSRSPAGPGLLDSIPTIPNRGLVIAATLSGGESHLEGSTDQFLPGFLLVVGEFPFDFFFGAVLEFPELGHGLFAIASASAAEQGAHRLGGFFLDLLDGRLLIVGDL